MPLGRNRLPHEPRWIPYGGCTRGDQLAETAAVLVPLLLVYLPFPFPLPYVLPYTPPQTRWAKGGGVNGHYTPENPCNAVGGNASNTILFPLRRGMDWHEYLLPTWSPDPTYC